MKINNLKNGTMVNRVTLLGFVGGDPEIRHLDNGLSVANFNIATTKHWTDKDGKKAEETQWHRIVVWRGLADVAEKYVKKGTQLYLEGELKTRKYDKDGVTHYVTEVFAGVLKLLGKKEGESDVKFEQQASSITGEKTPQGGAMSNINDLPGANENPDDLPW